MPIRFSLQVSGSAFGHDSGGLLDTCRRAEDLGMQEIRVADHPGTTHDPFALLAFVAARTSTIRVGTYVLNMGVRHPLDVAISALTLAHLSGGRFTLGLGAGHTPYEWQARTLERPGASARVDRLVEVVEVLPELLAGRPVTFQGRHIGLSSARIEHPAAPDSAVPLLIGGSNRRILDLGAERADVVGITGLRRTKADGHDHAVDWSPDTTSDTIRRIDRAARSRPARPVIDALVQVVDPDPDRRSAAEVLAAAVDGLEADDALDCPFVLLGPAESIAHQLVEFEERWGITSYCVRPPALDHIAAVMERLNHGPTAGSHL